MRAVIVKNKEDYAEGKIQRLLHLKMRLKTY